MDAFRTISQLVEGPVYKEKKSKFIGYAIPLRSETEIAKLLAQLRQDHKAAAHICYAWKIGHDGTNYRAKDDGEPRNSAGAPILGQINARELTDILVAVVRYYGGKKLGVGGLITAYRTTAKQVLETATIIKREIQSTVQISCGYESVDLILQKARRNKWKIISKENERNLYAHAVSEPGRSTLVKGRIWTP